MIWTLGLYAAAGFTFNVLTSMLAPLVIVLAIADDVHIVQHFDHELRVSGSKAHRLQVGGHPSLYVPLLGASGTTALGMLSLATSDVVAVRAFGIGAAIGIMVDFAISLVFVPTLLTLVRPDPDAPPQERWLMAPLQRVGRFAFTHPRWVVSVVLGITVAAGARGRPSARRHQSHQLLSGRPSAVAIGCRRRSPALRHLQLQHPASKGRRTRSRRPKRSRRMERLSNDLSRLPYVRKVTSVADYVKRVNQQLADGSKDAYRLPTSREAVAQELFVFGLSDEGRAELSRVVASDFSRAQISIKLASMSSDLVFDQIRIAEELADAAFAGSSLKLTVTGSGRLFATLDHYLVVSQLSSFAHRVPDRVRRDLRRVPIRVVRTARHHRQRVPGRSS